MGRGVAANTVAEFYMHSCFAEGVRIPYMVKLDEGKLLQVPADVIRPLPCLFEELLDDDLQNMIVWATTEGGAIKPAAALRGVNKKLRTMVEETRTWHNEWVAMWMERNKLTGESFPRSRYEAGGDMSIETVIEYAAANIKLQVDNGWPQEQAEAYQVITASLAAPLAAAVRERSDRYAASTRLVCEVLAERAKQMTVAAPLVYWNLTGKFGLATVDPAWDALTQPGASAGLGFVTNGVVQGDTADSRCFPDDKGYCKPVSTGGKLTFELQDSDVVCFHSAAADADGYHSLVHIGGAGHTMPPLATVTLEKVEEPGEWEVCGHKVQRRLFTVRVSFKENVKEVMEAHLRGS